ncbi:hypothetical protein ACFL14_00995 [Patescibacteria group bacterium]
MKNGKGNGPVEGILIDNAQTTQILHALRARIKNVYAAIEDPSISWIDITYPKVAGTVKTFEVVVDDSKFGWDGRLHSSEVCKAIKEILLPIVKKDISVSLPHSRHQEPESDDEMFHIYLWSAPPYVEKIDKHHDAFYAPKRLYEIDVNCRDSGFMGRSENGIPFYDYDHQYLIAELVGDNLYIRHDICHCGSNREIRIFCHILQEVAEYLSLGHNDRLRWLSDVQRKLSEILKSRFVKICNRRMKREIDQATEEIDTSKRKIRAYQGELAKYIRLQQNATRKRDHLITQTDLNSDSFGAEFDRLLALPSVAQVQTEEDRVMIHTHTLFCTDPRTNIVHEIGRFLITVHLGTSGSEECIRWKNLTRRVDGHDEKMHAPHVFPEGNACLGNMSQAIPRLVANYEITAIAIMAIKFIESVNIDDAAGKHIHKWPIADKSEIKESEQTNG